ncbi:WecB/TagA/CpsF family glycosyltransferase [Lacticaseibacillus saniviri]|uniref:N-acetylglucosaminyldiphosphoundecaprenol N-acetyl-beta-D-mannosaminyltransferase n=1 Tax=Lacticaseibacillus saniviri JCM 17471 = DSM 24301 TaxID=1293598 RepID=A0A0R2MUJ9_9LACO|nr:WecB/TagA/CpsF family glycosyltransferase [Lacticaseibacillus saniviri]KRO16002.1 glycosyltransferase [Lacticaseibacillus saniviri JCM 17471 = DSM 24301]MCG4281260.1 WecB/TagA/CpsF family glycosyltransferase [Lacticaseibacillus saniviri]
MTKVDVLGVKFDRQTMAEFMTTFTTRIAKHQGTFVVTANPEIVMFARKNPAFAQLLADKADFITADGIGVVRGAAMLNTPLPERVTGYDLMINLLEYAEEQQLKIALVGAKASVNQQAAEKVQTNYPHIKIVYTHDGYFDLSDTSVQQDLIASQPDMVFAALGFPKQEQFLAAIQPALPAAYLMGVGGSFDVLSGTVKRAPKLFQQLHLEWFYRLLKQPSRIGRMAELPRFLQAVKQQAKKGQS